MEFRIADTFTDSLARLTGDEQKVVKTTAFDLQMDPANPGMQLHKLDRAKDRHFWSVRVGSDIRLIVHRTDASFLLCYVDHHDKAYGWAERRKLQTHPKTGAAQWVEIRETIQEIRVPTVVAIPPPRAKPRLLFGHVSTDDLMGYGVPEEWLDAVKSADEDALLSLTEHLPAEASEALLELATGGTPKTTSGMTPVTASPFEHPDARRRFRTMSSVEELRQALEYPWEKWTVFLHPEQRQWMERDFAGPARVSGSAGTGKTIVALHRAVYLARKNPDARVLLTTYSDTLANALRTRLRRLISSEPRLAERIDIHGLRALGKRLYESHLGKVVGPTSEAVDDLLVKASAEVGDHKFTARFLRSEWDQVVDAWQIETWQEYRDVARLGRKTKLREPQRALLWSIFAKVQAALQDKRLLTEAAMFTAVATVYATGGKPPFAFSVVDESQDLGVAHLRFFAAIGAGKRNGLFFAGDLGQRIFQQPFSWKALGVEIRGRSKTLRVNYRTSHQIRTQADRLLSSEVTDVDGNTETRKGTVSAFNGPAPMLRTFKTEATERTDVATWLKERVQEGMSPHELGVFVRATPQLARASAAVLEAGLLLKVLDEHVETQSGHVSIGTMHVAKGLEFRAVAVMACDDEIVPLQERLESVGDDADLQEVYDTERQLLYVACTRARDALLVTSVEPASEFLDDMAG